MLRRVNTMNESTLIWQKQKQKQQVDISSNKLKHIVKLILCIIIFLRFTFSECG